MTKYFNAVLFASSTSGTANFGIGAAVTGYQTPSAAGIANGDAVSYRAENADLSQWQEGTATYNTTGPVLTRLTVTSNNLGTTAEISFTNPPNVGLVQAAADITAQLVNANNLSDVSSVSTARTNLGVTATGADTTYNARASNLSDVANAATARTNLGVTATGADTTYAARANNLSDITTKYTAMDNLSIHGADIVAAGTTNLETATGNLIDVTGSTTITAITLSEGHQRTVRFTGAPLLTNGASLVLPGGANIQAAAGDFAVFVGYAASVVRCVRYVPASVLNQATLWNLVSYGAAQALTDAQKAVARPNIYAAPFDALAYNGMQVNGSCDVSQENGTTQITLASGSAFKYVVDGWEGAYGHVAATAVLKMQQVTPPGSPSFGTAIPSCVQMTATTLWSPGSATDYTQIVAPIEGYRCARLSFGHSTAAQSVSIGFWIYATIAGTMTVGIRNNAFNRSYVSNITINNAVTWEYKTVTIPGDATGTWLANSSIGLNVTFCFGAGTNYSGTNNAWQAGSILSTSSTTNFFASTNNTVCLTGLIVLPGVELPSSSRAPFIMRPFDQELDICFRYLERMVGSTGNDMPAYNGSGTSQIGRWEFKKRKRVSPTMSYSALSNFTILGSTGYSSATPSAMGLVADTNMCEVNPTATIGSGGQAAIIRLTGGYIQADARL